LRLEHCVIKPTSSLHFISSFSSSFDKMAINMARRERVTTEAVSRCNVFMTLLIIATASLVIKNGEAYLASSSFPTRTTFSIARNTRSGAVTRPNGRSNMAKGKIWMSTTDEDEASTKTTVLPVDSAVPSSKILRRYLGKGPDAVVREGCVLVAPSYEYHHLLMRSALFVYGIGENELGETVARAVIVDHPTAFTAGEMMDLGAGGAEQQETVDAQQEQEEEQPKKKHINDNIMFRGGDMGKDIVMMLHSYEGSYAGKNEMIGSSGIYEGGLRPVLEALKNGDIEDPSKSVKLFFNYYEFSKQQLDDMFDTEPVDSEDGEQSSEDLDSWMSLEVDPSFLLNSALDKAEAWQALRNSVRQLEMAKN
jgi:hypothetical protein